MILTDEQRTDVNPPVSFEDGTTPLVQPYYERADVGLTTRPGAFGTAATNGSKVQLLTKTGQSLGVSKLLKVMVKDKINVTVDYYFAAGAANNSGANGINSLINTLLPFFNGSNAPAALKGSGGVITQQLNTNTPLNTLLAPQNASVPSALPKAYLNILFFDEQMKFVSQNSKIVPVSVAGSRQPMNEPYIEAPKNGYVYVYVSNESNNLVYFGNFQVSHSRGPVLEETHLYPFGSKMTAICSRALPGVQNSLAYQSKELDEEFDLDWYNFEARYYDPQTGRFIQIDPAGQFASGYTGMGNNWVMGTDPDGQWVHIAIGALVGGTINLVTHWGQVKSFGDGLAAFGIGAAAGALGAATGGASLAATGLGAASIGGGALAGFAGAAIASPVQGIGNAVYFGDNYSPSQWGRDMIMGGVIGGAAGGIANLFSKTPKNIWTGVDKFKPGWSPSTTNGKLVRVVAEDPIFDKAVIDGKEVTEFAGKISGQVGGNGDEVIKEGYGTFKEFKKVYGSAGKGNAWHHVVEQNPSNIQKFGPAEIHTKDNLIKLAHGKGSIHAKISGHYSSKQLFTNGQTVRQWLNSQTWQQQYDYGIKMLKQFGGTP